MHIPKPTRVQKEWLKPLSFRAARKHIIAATRLDRICNVLPRREPRAVAPKNTTVRTWQTTTARVRSNREREKRRGAKDIVPVPGRPIV